MKRLAFLAAVLCPISCVASEDPEVSVVTFDAIVESVELVSGYSGPLIPVDLDVRFAVSLSIVPGTTHGNTVFGGSKVVLGVHSPARVFWEAEDPVGTAFAISMTRKKWPHRTQYSELKAEKKAAEPGATDNPDDPQRLREDH